MKHDFKIILWLISLFLSAQIVGLLITNEYIDHQTTQQTGNVTFGALPYNVERPVVEESTSFGYILSAILIGTVLVMLLIRFKKVMIWKTWFFISVWLVLTVSLGAFLHQNIAVVLALALAFWKIIRPNIIVHNLTEVFIYGGLAAIFVPIMNLFSAIMMLAAISVYDMYAVWKSKHMIKMATFQAKTKVFAGFLIPYHRQKKHKKGTHTTQVKTKNAILGGGDIGFTLIFAGVVMKQLMLSNPIGISLLKSFIIPVMVTAALFLLFVKGKENRFYPAMPFLSIGAIVGYSIVWLIGF